jgi:hypothetical protein
MRSVIRKQVRWAHLLGGAILVCVALMNSARAAFFRVDLLGSYTYQSVLVPFATSFYIDTTCGGTSTNCAITPFPYTQPGSVPITAYPLAAVTGLSISLAGVQFSQSDLFPFLSNTSAVVLFNGPLVNEAAPLLDMNLISSDDQYALGLGGAAISPPTFTFFASPMPMNLHLRRPPNTTILSGSFSAHVLGFSGTPGSPSCHGASTSALAHKYGNMPRAAVALGYSSVKSLQADITLFCGS